MFVAFVIVQVFAFADLYAYNRVSLYMLNNLLRFLSSELLSKELF